MMYLYKLCMYSLLINKKTHTLKALFIINDNDYVVRVIISYVVINN